MFMHQIPCKNCPVLPICISKLVIRKENFKPKSYQSYYLTYNTFTLFFKLHNHCSLLEDYIKFKNYELNEVEKFFKEYLVSEKR